MEDIRTTLNKRAKTHGNYLHTATASQNMKLTLRRSDNWEHLTHSQREAADMIVHKLARITNGNPHEPDHWRDIIGYAQLVMDIIMTSTPKQET